MFYTVRLSVITTFGTAGRRGISLQQDYAERPCRSYRKAPIRDAARQNTLGVPCADGHGVNQDHAEAVSWLRKAADQG